MLKQKSLPTKKLSEAHIQRTLTDWLALDGWRCVTTDIPHLRGLGVSEPGMADNLYIRYLYDPRVNNPDSGCQCGMLEACACAEVMHIEWKKKGGKAAQHQQSWHAKERARGALTLIASENFPASIEGFAEWYHKSGLQRKKMSLPR